MLQSLSIYHAVLPNSEDAESGANQRVQAQVIFIFFILYVMDIFRQR